jgi:hypothetical protein
MLLRPDPVRENDVDYARVGVRLECNSAKALYLYHTICLKTL